MIRRTVFGAVCILLVLLLGVMGECYLRTAQNDLLSALRPPESNEADEILAAAENAVSVWQKHEKRLSAIVNHADAEALAAQFSYLRQTVDNADAAAAYRLMQNSASLVRILLAGERLAWENIL